MGFNGFTSICKGKKNLIEKFKMQTFARKPIYFSIFNLIFAICNDLWPILQPAKLLHGFSLCLLRYAPCALRPSGQGYLFPFSARRIRIFSISGCRTLTYSSVQGDMVAKPSSASKEIQPRSRRGSSRSGARVRTTHLVAF